MRFPLYSCLVWSLLADPASAQVANPPAAEVARVLRLALATQAGLEVFTEAVLLGGGAGA